MRQWFLSLAALALVASPAFAGKYNKVLSIGDKAPAIAGVPAVDGDKEITMNLGDVKEDVVVVVFLANHCPVVQAVEDRPDDRPPVFPPRQLRWRGLDLEGQPLAVALGHQAQHRVHPGLMGDQVQVVAHGVQRDHRRDFEPRAATAEGDLAHVEAE